MNNLIIIRFLASEAQSLQREVYRSIVRVSITLLYTSRVIYVWYGYFTSMGKNKHFICFIKLSFFVQTDQRLGEWFSPFRPEWILDTHKRWYP